MTSSEIGRGEPFVALSAEDVQEVMSEARSWLQTSAPCCGRECGQCPPRDLVADAIQAGVTAGILFAMKRISYRIRAELVCCTDEGIERMYQQLLNLRGAQDERDLPGFHGICYWGEMGARLAEDGHSLLDSPYECSGKHPGHCWHTPR